MRELWIRTEDTEEMVQNFILHLFEEDQEYYAGEMIVVVYDAENNNLQYLSHVYDVSEKAINTFREHYGDNNIMIVEKRNVEDVENEICTYPDLEDVERHLCNISASLSNIDDSLARLAACISETPRGTLFSICGNVSQN